jgi:cbb3-type cytochrome oxidase subunit 3
MTYFLFAGDMLVMAFMAALVVWLYLRKDNAELDGSARIPLEDERHDG